MKLVSMCQGSNCGVQGTVSFKHLVNFDGTYEEQRRNEVQSDRGQKRDDDVAEDGILEKIVRR